MPALSLPLQDLSGSLFHEPCLKKGAGQPVKLTCFLPVPELPRRANGSRAISRERQWMAFSLREWRAACLEVAASGVEAPLAPVELELGVGGG